MIQVKLSHKFRTLSLNRGNGFVGKHSFGFLNVSQFLSALNDNLFKFLTIYLLIDLQGVEHSSDILFCAGVSYVLPFLLFSNLGGILADRYSKQKMIVLLKVLEVVVIGASFFVYSALSVWGCYFLVFMLSLQSALMSPSKYSIIPELVRKDLIPRANGLITSFTYLAIIIGTFLASFITQITNRNFPVALSVCMLAAIVGLVTSFYIPHTPPKMNRQKISPWVLSQIYTTLTYCRKTPRLILAVVGAAFFLFIGAYLQLNIIPFAINTLGVSEVGGGYLFLTMAIGIAIGSTLGGKACRREIDLGLSVFALLAIGVMLLIFPLLCQSIPMTVVALVVMGFFGGLYVVPLESYIQSFSPSEVRGQVVATSGFLSFFGVLLAPLCLALFGKVFSISAGTGFTLIGVLTLATVVLMIRYLSLPFFHFLSRKCVEPFLDLRFMGYPFGVQYQEERIAILFEKKSWRNLGLLVGESSKMHIFIIRDKPHFFDKFLNYLSNVDVIYAQVDSDPVEVQKKIDARLMHIKPVFMFSSQKAYDQFLHIGYFKTLSETHMYQIKRFRVKHTSHFKPSWTTPLKWSQMTLQFSDYKVVGPATRESVKTKV